MIYCYGIDIGGTAIKMGLFDRVGNLLDKWEVPTNTNDQGKYILAEIAQAIKDNMKNHGITANEVTGIGVGVPGPVQSNGIVLRCVNLGWSIINIKEELEALTGLRVIAGNDANVAALGELFKGGGTGYRSLVMVTLGTGVGGGVIIDGKIVSGANGSGGEIGHFRMRDDEKETCGCGNKGCLEQYASATGIVRLAKELLEDSQKPEVVSSCLSNTDLLTAEAILNAAKAGDPIGKVVVEQVGRMLGKAMAILACAINPEVFVFGGGVSKAGDILLNAIQENYIKMAFHGTRDTAFTIAKLGNDAGIYGGAKLVLDGCDVA